MLSRTSLRGRETDGVIQSAKIAYRRQWQKKSRHPKNRKKEARKDRLHQNYLKRKASGKQKEYEERTKGKKKSQIDSKKKQIRAEDGQHRAEGYRQSDISSLRQMMIAKNKAKGD